jgi:hypothetical protein
VIHGQVAAVGALIALSALLVMDGVHSAIALTGAGLCVLVVLFGLGGVFARQVRLAALDVILEGGEHFPLSAVERQRSRLLEQHRREQLAQRLEALVYDAVEPRPRQALELRAVSVRNEILEAAALIRGTRGGACGIARAERLVTAQFLDAHGGDIATLRCELDRVIDPLRAAATSRDG